MYVPAVGLTSHISRCSLTDDHHASPFLSADLPAAPFGSCTPHDPSPSQYSMDDILCYILKSRKNWKTLKGRSEAVWPPYLEAAMFKALQEYEPDDSRETRMLGRHPMRNRFISDYIHTTTGKFRSAKQVGSRLQQLRDTAEGRELIDALTRCYRMRMDAGTCNARVPVCRPPSEDASSTTPPPTISCDASSTTPTITTPTTSSATPDTAALPIMSRLPPPRTRQPPEIRMPVYIDILPPTGYSHPSASTSNANARPSDAARQIHNIDPTVTFVSPSPVNGKSSYIVLLDGAPVHSEDTALEYVGPYFSSPMGPPRGDQPTLYSTALVPKYWDVLCKAADPILYTIIQDVHCVPNPAPSGSYSQRPRPTRIFSAIYHFQYPPSTGPASTYGQVPLDASRSVPSMTSPFDVHALHGALPVGFARPTTFPASSSYAPSAPQGFRTPAELDQNLFDEPFMLDVNFEQVAFDDFVLNMDSTADSAASHVTPRDPNNFFM